MVREKVFSDSPDDEDGFSPGFDADSREIDERLRPERLEDVIGQTKVVERVRVILEATKKRNDTLGHVLFDGLLGSEKRHWPQSFPRNWASICKLPLGQLWMLPRICCRI